MEPLIRFENVTVFDSTARAGRQAILDGVSFEVGAGEKAVLYGRSGSGKSTILTTLAGAHIPSGGSIWFEEMQVNAESLDRVRRSLAFIGQEPVLGAGTVREALMLPFTFRANRDLQPDQHTVNEVLHSLRLDPAILDSEASVVSGGEKQRIAIARALLLNKKAFLADEITSALDPESKDAVISLFRDRPLTLLSVSHDREWFSICTTFMQVDKGSIVNVADRAPGG